MNPDTVATEPLTLEHLQNAMKKLREAPKVPAVPNMLLVGSQNMKLIRYFAMKYPAGATIVSKIDKRKYKNKGSSKKRYFVKYKTPAIETTTYLEREAFRIFGIYHISHKYIPADKNIHINNNDSFGVYAPFEPVGVCNEQESY